MQAQPVNTFILQRQPTESWSAFIDYWAMAYDYLESNSAYDQYVSNRDSTFEFDKDNLRALFTWKNKTGDQLTAKKEGTMINLIDSLPKINQLRQQWNDEAFRAEFGSISAVWQTFLMHIIQPERFPIFDQHVYRAYSYLQPGQPDELNRLTTTRQKMVAYGRYQLFFNTISKGSGSTPRAIDKALWAFGRFIKQYPALVR